MQKYSEFQPTNFDYKGLELPDQQDWLVIPVMRTRDSGALEESNFETALKQLGGESADVEVCRFNHWGPGWFEIIVINPENKEIVKLGEKIGEDLEDYPILDEDDWADKEYNDFLFCWEEYASSDFVKEMLQQFNLNFPTENLLNSLDYDTLLEFYRKDNNEPYFSENGGVFIPIERRVKEMSRKSLAEFIKTNRKNKQ